MRRSWCLPVATFAIAGSSLLATAGAASASSVSSAAIQPGGVAHFAGGGDSANSTVTSTNWSGYAAKGGTYKSVSASWTEPTGHCKSGTHQYSSFWVGLDGYNSNSVEQTGSEVDCVSGKPKYYAWYEMFPAYPVNFGNSVTPGDHFTASVVFNGSGKFTLKLSDTTKHWTHTEHKTLKSAKRSSAEVIVEAPSSSSGVLPLADFGKINIASSKVNGKNIGSLHPVRIIMKAGGTTKDSVTALSGGTKFSATWKHA